MRKVVIFLCLLALLLTSCANAVAKSKEETVEEPVSNEIELTKENYEDYLEVTYSLRETDSRYDDYGGYSFSVKGNVHYKYNHVELKVHIWGFGGDNPSFPTWDKNKQYHQWLYDKNVEKPMFDFDCTETIRLNLAGNASQVVPLLGLVKEEFTYIELISVSGTLEEYK